MTDEHRQGDYGLATKEAKPKLKKPPLFRVILLNDDYTPMEFVVEVLERIFSMGSVLSSNVSYMTKEEKTKYKKFLETKLKEIEKQSRKKKGKEIKID